MTLPDPLYYNPKPTSIPYLLYSTPTVVYRLEISAVSYLYRHKRLNITFSLLLRTPTRRTRLVVDSLVTSTDYRFTFTPRSQLYRWTSLVGSPLCLQTSCHDRLSSDYVWCTHRKSKDHPFQFFFFFAM